MAPDQDIRRRFSPDYLVTGSAPLVRVPDQREAKQTGPSALDEAVIAYSQPILRVLRALPEKQIRVHDLIERVNDNCAVNNFEEFVGVVSHLEKLHFLETIQRDLRGNHLIKLVRA